MNIDGICSRDSPPFLPLLLKYKERRRWRGSCSHFQAVFSPFLIFKDFLQMMDIKSLSAVDLAAAALCKNERSKGPHFTITPSRHDLAKKLIENRRRKEKKERQSGTQEVSRGKGMSQ